MHSNNPQNNSGASKPGDNLARTSWWHDVSDSQLQSCWPTPPQELLLQAALWQGEKSLAAFEKWKPLIDIEHLDEGSTRLLPLLLANLKRQNVDDPIMARFKSVHRHTWYRNQLMFRRAADLIQDFEKAGIKTMILKGAPLVLSYYKDLGLRPMNDVDFLVPTAQSSQAAKLLRQWGWKPVLAFNEEFNERFVSFSHAIEFRNEKNQSLDLHRHLLGQCCWKGADTVFWKDALPIELQGVATLAPTPTDLLIHVCLHGVQWQSVSPMRWVADAMVILQASENSDDPQMQVNWKRLEKIAASHRVSLPLYDGLKFLLEKMGAPVPTNTLTALKRMKSTRAERLEYSASLRPPHSFGPLFKLWLRYRSFLRWERRPGPLSALMGFPRYLQHTWELENVAQVPAAAIKKSRRQLRQQRTWRRVSDKSSTKTAREE